MEHLVPMGARKPAICNWLLIAGLAACFLGYAHLLASQEPAPKPPQVSSSPSGQKSHRHRTTVAEEEGPQPELARAEELIQKRDYSQAETALQKLVASDPENYVAWFDLGFVENGLDRQQESIAAYRKSVAAKPDVFESNLNLGLMLARSSNPEAEVFLRAATTLKPTDHVEEAQARAWLALARLLENKKP